MTPRKFTDPKKFALSNDTKTLFVWSYTSKNKGAPYEVFVRIEKDYRWSKPGTNWMHFAKFQSDTQFVCEGYVPTSWLKLHSKTMLESGALVVCSDKPAAFKSVSVR